MPNFDYLNQSSFQWYPLKNSDAGYDFGGLALRREWLLDAGITFGVSSGYTYQGEVNLYRVESDGTNVAFYFSYGDIQFIFLVPVDAEVGRVSFEEQAYHAVEDTYDAKWGFGMLQTGDLSYFATHTGNWTGTAPVERTLVQTLYNHYVQSVNLANAPTTVIDEPPCGLGSSSFTQTEYSTDPIPVTALLVGDVKFYGGYYAQVTADAENRVITIQPADTAEQSEVLPCNPSSLLVYPVDYVLPERPDCKDLIFTVNGIKPNDSNLLTFEESLGFEFSAVDDHSLRITLNHKVLFQDSDIEPACPSSFQSTYSNVFSSTESPVFCDIVEGSNAYGDSPFIKVYDLTATLGGVNRRFDLGYMHSETVPDRLIIRANDGHTIFDSGCVTTPREIRTNFIIHPADSPITVQVIPDCNGLNSTAWYFHLGCFTDWPTVTKNDCTYTVQISGTNVNSTRVLTFQSGTRWASSGDYTTIVFWGGWWWLITTDGSESILYTVADDSSGGPPLTGWTLRYSTATGTPVLNITENCPG